MAQKSTWAPKVMALIQAGNVNAALAQIKVAPTPRDLQQLRKLLTDKGVLPGHRVLDDATNDMIAALSAPRLHRSP